MPAGAPFLSPIFPSCISCSFSCVSCSRIRFQESRSNLHLIALFGVGRREATPPLLDRRSPHSPPLPSEGFSHKRGYCFSRTYPPYLARTTHSCLQFPASTAGLLMGNRFLQKPAFPAGCSRRGGAHSFPHPRWGDRGGSSVGAERRTALAQTGLHRPAQTGCSRIRFQESRSDLHLIPCSLRRGTCP